jgi:cell division protein FtsL
MVVANRAEPLSPRIYQYPQRKQEQISRHKARRPLVNLRKIRRVLAGVTVVALALLVVFRYGQISQINMEINRATITRNALIDEQRHLEISIAELTALDRLEKIALEEMGLQYPHPEQIRFVGYTNPESRDGDGG